MNDWFEEGATAEFCLTQPQNIALKPKSLSHELAATVPISALTAWQGLLDRAKIRSGERVLISRSCRRGRDVCGSAGAPSRRIRIAAASAGNTEFVKRLGADEVIDYTTSRFEDQVGKIDVVFDAVGGETLNRSWAVLKPTGRLVTIAADSEGTTDQRVKDAFFIVEPNQKQLFEIAKMLDAGSLKAFVSAIVPLAEASAAYSRTVRDKHGYGKVVIAVSA